jgi:aryl-phospho-beta-D-glucosidase BglC (GH1 family)
LFGEAWIREEFELSIWECAAHRKDYMQKDFDWRTTRLRGVNLGGWFSQIDCIEEKDPGAFVSVEQHMKNFLKQEELQKIADAGMNHVRLPVDYFNFFQEDGYLKTLGERFEYLDKAISLIRSLGLAIILDLHKCPGHDFHLGMKSVQSFFTNQSRRDQAKYVWSVLAERYGNQGDIALEILNEPVAPNADVWNRVKEEMFLHIRQQAPNSCIVVGSNRWNIPQEFCDLTPLDDDNILYSFHSYNPLLFTHQRATWMDDPLIHHTRTWPGNYEAPPAKAYNDMLGFGKWDRQALADTLEPALNFRHKYNVPVACNEFGVFVQADRKGQLGWMEDMLSIFYEYDIGYSYWNFKNLDFGILSKGESLHQNLAQYQNVERCDYALLQLLAHG